MEREISINVFWSLSQVGITYKVSQKVSFYNIASEDYFERKYIWIFPPKINTSLEWGWFKKKGIDANYTSPAPKSIWAWFLKRSSFCSLRGPEN
mgnify:CR=1 FL=1